MLECFIPPFPSISLISLRASQAGISTMQRYEKAKLPRLMNCLGSERGELGQTCIKL